jgi:hypothetical protein
MSEMLAEAIGESVPDGLRDALRALDQGKGWNQSKKAEKWVVNACLRAQRSDVLVEKINQHRVERLTGIRRGAGAVAKLLSDCPSLAHLEFCGATISDDEAAALVLALRDCQGVVTLAFRNCTISNGAMSALVAGLPENLQTLRIEAGGGTWLDTLGPGIAVHTTLTSLVLQIPNLRVDRALKLGKSLRGNRTLMMLEVHVASPKALTSLLKGLASTEELGIDGGSLRVVEQPSALPCLARLDLRSHARLDGAFCDALSECIETRKALASIRIRPDVQALEEPIARLRNAIENSDVKIDFDASNMPAPLTGLAKFRPYQQMILPADAPVVVARRLLKSLPGWDDFPGELRAKIEGDLFGNGSLRELWPLLGLMSLSKEVCEFVTGIRSAIYHKRFAAPIGRPDLPYEPDLDAFMHFWRLQLSGFELGDSDALVLPEWQLTSKESSGLSLDQRVFRNKLTAVGNHLVDEHLTWVSRWIDEGNREAAAFVLNSLQRLAKAHGFDHEDKAGELNQRLILSGIRYQRRNACFNIARSLSGLAFLLAMADGLADGGMRYLFDPDRAYGIGSSKSFEAGKDQRGTGLGLTIGAIVMLYVLFRIADEWAAHGRRPAQPSVV